MIPVLMRSIFENSFRAFLFKMEHVVLLTTSFAGFTECPPGASRVPRMNKLLEQSELAPRIFKEDFAE